jgi:2-dehydro-3-deoxyphosphogluconate aldolase / (4S)-4-hydroxy-2-oxoglutarate aldolase
MGWEFPQGDEIGPRPGWFPRGIAPLRRPVWDTWSLRPERGLVNAKFCGVHGSQAGRSFERLHLICAISILGPVTLHQTDCRIEMRGSNIAAAVREARLVVVLRRIAPRERLLDLVAELVEAGARIFEVTLDSEDAGDDLAVVREHVATVSRIVVGAGTIRTDRQLRDAMDAGAAFGVSPVFDPAILAAAIEANLPFVPGAYTPTEADAAWRAGATFVKLFPGSSLGPAHVRELRGPLPEIETIVTGGVDATKAVDFLEAGAVAVGIGSAIVRATAEERRLLLAAIAMAGSPNR